MSSISHLAATLFRKSKQGRLLVAVAGPPGAGKSTFTEALLPLLPEGSAAVVPMDGFHFDNAVLDRRGLRARKGAPETFDFDGFESLLQRLRAGEAEVAVPLFDRAADLARAGAAIVSPATRFVIAEGNYLLLDEQPWTRLAPLFDVTVYLDVAETVLEERLIRRWLDLGHAPDAARERALANDIPNARRVAARRRTADIVLPN